MASWESDQLVVVMKQGNACGAKGLAGEPWSRDTSSGHGTGAKKTTKLDSMTYSTEGEEVVLKSRMREICKSGSVRGLVVDSPKGLATRPTRPRLNSISVKGGLWLGHGSILVLAGGEVKCAGVSLLGSLTSVYLTM